ncbi:MAG: oligoendopeptidase [Synergistaceae bacterium]|nr:oligoendopeptidase [Synergistaceae bacterium]
MNHCRLFSGTVTGEADPSGRIPARSEIPREYTWDLEAVFPTAEAWEESFRLLGEEMERLGGYNGRLFESPETLLEFLKLEEAASERMGKLYAYAVMKSHEDTADAARQARADRAGSLLASYGAVLSFYRPEILAAGKEKVNNAIKACPGLEMYRHHFDDLLRTAGHVLGPQEEEILARSGEMARTPENAFSLLTNADLTFPVIRDESGRETELSEERYYLLSRSKDRRVRKDAFEGLFTTYGKFRNTLAALYSGSVKSDLFFSRARKYTSALEASLHGDNISPSVYDMVVDTVNRNLDALHGYMALRKKTLGLEELRMYDLNVPLADEPETRIPYGKAVEMVTEGLAPLGTEYLDVLKKGFSSRWIDVYENQGKRKGAYSWGSYGTHPYILLNYNGTLRDVFTIAHEAGHSLHTWFSHAGQPQVYADYTIFLAEVASTTNEALLLEFLLEKAPKEEKIFLLNHYLDQVRTTVYRQTMFAEFERETHALAEKGEALTAELLCFLWRGLNERYHGPETTVDEVLSVEWARIPHFYSAFYVYKYVTGFAAAGCLSSGILKGGEEERRRYIRFLSRGSSAYSLDILREAGVDMTSPVPLEQTIRTFREKTALLENLLESRS